MRFEGPHDSTAGGGPAPSHQQGQPGLRSFGRYGARRQRNGMALIWQIWFKLAPIFSNVGGTRNSFVDSCDSCVGICLISRSGSGLVTRRDTRETATASRGERTPAISFKFAFFVALWLYFPSFSPLHILAPTTTRVKPVDSGMSIFYFWPWFSSRMG